MPSRPITERSDPSVAGKNPEGAPVSKRWKWTLCGILFLATVLNYLDRQTMGLCKSKIMDEFGLNNEGFGQLLAAFRWTYALTHVLAGFIADRFSLRLFFALAVGLWSFAGGIAFWVRNAGVFSGTRALLGLGEAVNWPFSTRIVANMLPREDRGLGMGIFNSGAAIGAVIAPLVITPIAATMGWRWAFLTIGAGGFLWVALWLWFTRGGRARAFANDPTRAPTHRSLKEIWAPFRVILSQPAFWLLVLISITINPCWYFCCDWIPGYLKEQSGFSFLRAGLLSTLIFLGGDIGNYVGGGCVKYFSSRGWTMRQARRATVFLGATLGTSIIFVPHVSNPTLAVALLAIAALGINTIVPNQNACQTEVSFENTAQLAGLTGLAANIFAALVNPRIGHYVDVTQHYDLIFYFVGAFPWVAAILIVVFDAVIAKRNSHATFNAI